MFGLPPPRHISTSTICVESSRSHQLPVFPNERKYQASTETSAAGSFASNEPEPGASGPPQNAEIPSGYRHFSSWATNGLGFHAAPQIPSLAFDHCPALRVP
jgi:hypothetical protein